MTHTPTSHTSTCRVRTAAALLALAGTLIGATMPAAAGLTGSSSTAHADPPCDQMRAQYGAGWPCISVPTYTGAHDGGDDI